MHKLRPTIFLSLMSLGINLNIPLAYAAQTPKVAPALEATLLDGSSFVLSKKNGKVVIINFWATWCAPCRQEMPAFEAYYRKHKDQGLELIAISVDEPADEAKVREVMTAYSFPAAMANKASFAGYGRIWRMPLTFVVDRNGRMQRDGWFGKPSIDLELLEKTVTPLLATQ